MSSHHDAHSQCRHESVRVCRPCDVAFCGREWRTTSTPWQYVYWHQNPGWMLSPPTSTDITWGGAQQSLFTTGPVGSAHAGHQE
jgi:hypothetical protein